MASSVTAGERLRIGERLIRAGLISEDQLREALLEQQRSGGKVVAKLVALGHIDQASFLRFLSRQPGVASIDLAHYSIPRELLSLVPVEFARRHEIVPMDKMGADLTVGMACPLDVKVIEELAAMTRMRVRALLVSPDAIKAVLDKYYPETPAVPAPAAVNPVEAVEEPLTGAIIEQIATVLTFEGVMTLVRSVSSLPALPDTIQRVRAAVENPEAGTRDVAEILKGDPALAAKVISLANAPAHGFKHRVNSIENATSLLGLREVYAITVSAAVVDCFGKSAGFNYPAFWRRSVTAGNVAKILARAGNVKAGNDVFAAGLLHDIGRAVFAEVAPGAYGKLDHGVPDDLLIGMEQETFGIAHPEVGYVVARNWGLPDSLAEAIRFHHSPERASDSPALVGLIALAARLTDHIDLPEAYPLDLCLGQCASALSAFGVDDCQLTSLLDIVRGPPRRGIAPGILRYNRYTATGSRKEACPKRRMTE